MVARARARSGFRRLRAIFVDTSKGPGVAGVDIPLGSRERGAVRHADVARPTDTPTCSRCACPEGAARATPARRRRGEGASDQPLSRSLPHESFVIAYLDLSVASQRPVQHARRSASPLERLTRSSTSPRRRRCLDGAPKSADSKEPTGRKMSWDDDDDDDAIATSASRSKAPRAAPPASTPPRSRTSPPAPMPTADDDSWGVIQSPPVSPEETEIFCGRPILPPTLPPPASQRRARVARAMAQDTV